MITIFVVVIFVVILLRLILNFWHIHRPIALFIDDQSRLRLFTLIVYDHGLRAACSPSIESTMNTECLSRGILLTCRLCIPKILRVVSSITANHCT